MLIGCMPWQTNSAHPEISSVSRSCRYRCDIDDCGKSFYHATLLIKHLEEQHEVTVGKVIIFLCVCLVMWWEIA